MSGHHRKLLSPLVAAFVAALTFLTAGPALAAPAQSLASARVTARSATVLPVRLRAFDWATTQAGKPYIYGGVGPAGYDCSGLVMVAYQHAGISLPRTTYEMLSSRHLVRVGRPAKGDLAFYGSGHVELYAHGDWTFGAHQTGQAIGWIKFGPWWHPTAYYRVR